MKKSLVVINNQVEFLHFLKAKFPIYNSSNLFFRDLHYGIISFFEHKGMKIGYGEAESIAREIAQHFEKQNILKKVNQQGWVLQYPEFTAKKAS
ncbi:MAG TPA: hypothetical protein VMM58_11980 [Bacteroidota bacterium]|nr:hypothetical protein [Bacteroidota bacterium]